MVVTHNFSIRTKLTVGFIGIVFLSTALVSTISYFLGKSLLKKEIFNTLSAIRNIKAGQVIQYLDMLRDQCLSTSESTMIFDAMEQFKEGFTALQASPDELARHTDSLKKFYTNDFLPKLNQTANTQYTLQDYFPVDVRTIISQDWYLAENPYPIQKKSDFVRANMQHAYNIIHEKYHPIFKRYAKRVGIADLYLVDIATGHVVYSLAKEIDFGTNLMSGPFKDSGLGKSFIEVQRTIDENFVKIIDFQFYDPSYGTPVGFISTPIYKEGKKIGALIFKFPIDTLNQIMTYNKQWSEAGLGESGESFLMGKDKYMRTISRQYLENPVEYVKMLREHGYDAALLDKIQVYDTTVLLESIRIKTIKEALDNIIDTIITDDINGKKIISTYAPIKLNDIEWYIFVEINTDEAFAPINTLLWQIALFGLMIIFISFILSCIYIWFLTKPLVNIIQLLGSSSRVAMQKISAAGSLEFTQFAQAYNAIVDCVDASIKKIRSVQEYIEDVNNDLHAEYIYVQKALIEIRILNELCAKQNKKILIVHENLLRVQQYDIATGVQNVHILNTIKGFAATLEKSLQSATSYNTEAENNLLYLQGTNAEALQSDHSDHSDHNDESYLLKTKTSIQNVARSLNSIVPIISSLSSHYEEYELSMNTLEKKQSEKRVFCEELRIMNEENQKNYLDIAKQIDIVMVAIEKLNVIYTRYADFARQLVMLIQEFDI